MAGSEDIHATIEKNKNALQDIDHMINSLNDVRSSVHHIFHILQGRTEPQAGAAFREHARFTYTALECLAKMAVSSEGITVGSEAPTLCQIRVAPHDLEVLKKPLIYLMRIFLGMLNDAQSLELPKLQGPSPVSLEAKQKEAQEEEKVIAGASRTLAGEMSETIVKRKSKDYLK
ncbi:hypothetical protein BGZ58_009971 [Dissophora ornata]|nr:hypothetical protein BGZ58_009971 [Dissophora ornata]